MILHVETWYIEIPDRSERKWNDGQIDQGIHVGKNVAGESWQLSTQTDSCWKMVYRRVRY